MRERGTDLETQNSVGNFRPLSIVYQEFDLLALQNNGDPFSESSEDLSNGINPAEIHYLSCLDCVVLSVPGTDSLFQLATVIERAPHDGCLCDDFKDRPRRARQVTPSRDHPLISSAKSTPKKFGITT